MNTQTRWVHIVVLNGTTHSASTRLIWLLLGGQPSGGPSAQTDIRLLKLSGLDARTIAAARARLIHAPLASCYGRPHRSCAVIPWLLVTNVDISASARLLYGQLQGVPDFAQPGGSFTYAALSQLTGSSVDTLRRAVAELVAAGWLTITQEDRKSPLGFTLRNPVSTRLRARISSLRRRLRSAQHRGEALLRELLNVLVATHDYRDNASPDFPLNPYTGELMELDRYYPTDGVAASV